MTIDIAIVLGLLFLAAILFVIEKLPADLVALLVMAILLLTRIITPEEGIAGFSNTATVTVGAMFVLSGALLRTGALSGIGAALTRISRLSLGAALITLMLSVGIVSAFVNNTAAVAIFLPLTLAVARDTQVSPSKLLMPLSFASMFGGVCTLIGSSTNILVSSIAAHHRQPPFGMFEFAPLGLIFFAAGFVYMLLVGVRLIPERRGAGDLTQIFEMGDYLTEIVLLPEGDSVGKALASSSLTRDLDVDVLEVVRKGEHLTIPPLATILQPGDILRVRCDVNKLKKLKERQGIALTAKAGWRDEDLESDELALVEAVIAPNSVLEGKSLKEANFREVFGATALAIRHRGELMHDRLASTRLQAGDALLVEVRRSLLGWLQQLRDFVIVSERGLPEPRKHKIFPAVLIIAGVVVTAALNVLPIVVSAVIGCVLLVLTGCISLKEAYESIEWPVIFLLAGVLTLGTALENTGAARTVSSWMISTIGPLGPTALMSAFFLVTSLLTAVMSNNATAALLAPIAIATAASLGVDSRPFLMAVTFAASASFMTPIGYQTNTLIHGPGQYRFADFLRVGTPLNLLFWLLGTLLIPRFWPF